MHGTFSIGSMLETELMALDMASQVTQNEAIQLADSSANPSEIDVESGEFDISSFPPLPEIDTMQQEREQAIILPLQCSVLLYS